MKNESNENLANLVAQREALQKEQDKAFHDSQHPINDAVKTSSAAQVASLRNRIGALTVKIAAIRKEGSQ